MNYKIMDKVYPSGIAETDITLIVNNRQLQIRTPWRDSRSRMGAYDIKVFKHSANGHLYECTVPVRILEYTDPQTGDFEYTLYEYKPDLPQEDDPTKLGYTVVDRGLRT